MCYTSCSREKARECECVRIYENVQQNPKACMQGGTNAVFRFEWTLSHNDAKNMEKLLENIFRAKSNLVKPFDWHIFWRFISIQQFPIAE